jgi:uncharacterized membrane protein
LRRRPLLSLVVLGLLVFLLISALLARAFSANGAEQTAITNLVKAEAAGNVAGMLTRIEGCAQRPSCRTRVAQDVADLKRGGAVSIINLQPSTGFSLSGMTGTARVAWRAGSSLPIVQCVRVRRSGDVISGLHVNLLELSARIKSTRQCPARY